MKALTIRQPWASLIAAGVKTIETRSWATKHRGRLAIHAGADVDHRAAGDLDEYLHKAGICFTDWQGTARHHAEGRSTGVRGAVVATADLVDCIPCCEGSGDADDLIYTTIDGKALYRQQVIGDPSNPRNVVPTDLTEQLPLGDYTPGRWAWLLDNVKPTTERCPACWGDGGFKEDSMVLYGVPGGEEWADPCPTCNPEGRCTEPLGVGAYGCDPIPAKGRQGLWEWAP